MRNLPDSKVSYIKLKKNLDKIKIVKLIKWKGSVGLNYYKENFCRDKGNIYDQEGLICKYQKIRG